MRKFLIHFLKYLQTSTIIMKTTFVFTYANHLMVNSLFGKENLFNGFDILMMVDIFK